ncbi:MAG: CYTH domain-containing protein [Agitococcus sp.]|nr:CYTH domain-containing protein [Agitococcus sp.]
MTEPATFEMDLQAQNISSGTLIEYWEEDNRWYPGSFVGLATKSQSLCFEKKDGSLAQLERSTQRLRLASVPSTREIERRFFVRDLHMLKGLQGELLIQAYLSEKGAQLTTRVRSSSEGKAWLTLKGRPRGDTQGATLGHDEFEYSIPMAHAQALMQGYSSQRISKTRYRIPFAGHVFEIDVFHDQLDGLVLAEVEMACAEEEVLLPTWLGTEVTQDPQYRNVNLVAQRPADPAAFHASLYGA